MKSSIRLCLLGILLGAGAVWLVHHPIHRKHEEEPDKPPELVHRESESGLMLSSQVQETMGLILARISPTNTVPRTQAFASAVDVSALVQSLQEIALARLHFQASEVEYRRLKSLFEQGQTASARSFEASELAMKRDQLAVTDAESLLRMRWGEDLSRLPELSTLVEALQHQRQTLIRITLLPGEGTGTLPAMAWIGAAGHREDTERLRILGRCPVREASVQGESFWAVAEGHRWGTGEPLLSWVLQGKEAQSGWMIPGSAIVRHEGVASVYLRRGTNRFERVRVELSGPISGGWLVQGSLTNGDSLVVTGVQQLLSSELKPSGGEE